MSARSIPKEAELVSEALLAAPNDAARREIATGLLAYSLGALAALDGDKKAAEVAYRFADALAARKAG